MSSATDTQGSDLVTFSFESEAPHGLSAFDIGQIVRQSWSNNLAHGITGVLIFSDDRFREVVEGPREEILRLVTRLVADNRHENIRINRFESISERGFEDWRIVGFPRSVGDVPESAVGGASDADKVIPLFVGQSR